MWGIGIAGTEMLTDFKLKYVSYLALTAPGSGLRISMSHSGRVERALPQ